MKLIGAGAVLPGVAAEGARAEPDPLGSGEWTVAALPDMQYYSENAGGNRLQYAHEQTQWIADNVGAHNIEFVSHEGDLVEHGDDDGEWKNIDGVMETLDGVVPYSVLPGNHDFAVQGDRLSGIQRFKDTFPPSRFDSSWFGGRGPPEQYTWEGHTGPAELNSYQTFSAGGHDFLHLALEWEPPGDIDDPATPLGWAQSVLDANPDRATILTTHSYLRDTTDEEEGFVERVPPWKGALQEKNGMGNQGEVVWNELISPNPQVFMVLGGHYHRMGTGNFPNHEYHAGEGHLVGTNDAGQAVFEMLGNYQWVNDFGDGWFRLIRFRPGAGAPDLIEVRTFTPSIPEEDWDAMWDDQYSQFEFDVDFDARFPSSGSGVGGDDPLPAPWENKDVGDVGAVGSASESDGTFTVEGSGEDIYGTADEFHYVYQPLSGDGEIVARVATQEDTGDFAKSGVMIRETLDDDSKNAMTRTDPSPEAGTDFQYRSSTGGETTIVDGDSSTAPVWVRLVRSGDTFTGYKSDDGASWMEIGSTTIAMATDVHVGLGVTSYNDGTLNTTTFDNVQVTEGGTTTLSVDTNPASGEKDTSATLNGNLADLGGADSADVWFTYWEEGNESNASTTARQNLTSTGTFDAEVTGLSEGTTHVFRAEAESEDGSQTDQGAERTLTTTGGTTTLSVETNDATDVSESEATLNGELTDLGGESSADVWFTYWEEGRQSETEMDTAEQMMTETGPFDATLPGLNSETTYVYVAEADNGVDSAQGSEVTFTTAQEGASDLTVIDDFETGTPGDNYNGDDGAAAFVDTVMPINGDQTLLIDSGGSFGRRIHSVPGDGLDRYFSKGDEPPYRVYFRFNNTAGRVRIWFGADSSTPDDDHYYFEGNIGNSNTALRRVTGGSHAHLDGFRSVSYSQDTWYRLDITWDDGTHGGSDNDKTVELYDDETGTLIDTFEDVGDNADSAHAGESGIGFEFSDTGNDSNDVYIDYAHLPNAGGGSDDDGDTSALSVETNDATDVTETSATLNGDLTDLGGESSADVWFAYWPERNESEQTMTDAQELNSAGTFEAEVTDLDPDTTYSFVVEADNGNDTDQGAERTFTTSASEDAGDGTELIVDDFETDLGPYGGDTDAASLVTSPPPVNGEQVLEIDPGGGFGRRIYSVPGNGLNAYFSKGDAPPYTVFVRFSGSGGRARILFGADQSDPSANHYRVGINVGNGDLSLMRETDGGSLFMDMSRGLSLSSNAWYRVEITWDDGTHGNEDDAKIVELYEHGSDTVLGKVEDTSNPNADHAAASGVGFEFSDAGNDSNDAYFDFAHRPNAD